MPRVKTAPNGVWRTVMPQAKLLNALLACKLPVQSRCRRGLCAHDVVLILEGAENLSEMRAGERETLTKAKAPPNARLSCVTRVIDGDVVVGLPERSYALYSPQSPMPGRASSPKSVK